MKKVFAFLLLAFFFTNVFAQTTCSNCGGYGKFLCNTCGGGGVIYQQIWNPYYGIYQSVPYRCAACNGYGALICSNCEGRGYVVSASPSFQGSTTSFVKTNAKCKTCSGCSGYWGIKHLNGTYEGACSNSDGWGHRCGHGPEKHGLRKW